MLPGTLDPAIKVDESKIPPPSYDAPPPYNPSTSLVARLSTVPKEIKDNAAELYKELKRVGLEKHEARVCIMLDISHSMQNPNEFFYSEETKDISQGKIQRLINKALALSILFDDDQRIEVFPFAGTAFEPVIITKENFIHAAELIFNATGGTHPGTSYADPVIKARTYYFKDEGERKTPQLCNKPPVFCIFITDGDLNLKKIEATNEFVSASHQAIFFKFLAFRGKPTEERKDETDETRFSFLLDIDNPLVKNAFFVDNADLVILNQPEELTTQQLIHEYRGWALHALKKGILGHDPKITAPITVSCEGRVTTTPGTLFAESSASSAPTAMTAPATASSSSSSTTTTQLPPKVDPACCRIL